MDLTPHGALRALIPAVGMLCLLVVAMENTTLTGQAPMRLPDPPSAPGASMPSSPGLPSLEGPGGFPSYPGVPSGTSPERWSDPSGMIPGMPSGMQGGQMPSYPGNPFPDGSFPSVPMSGSPGRMMPEMPPMFPTDVGPASGNAGDGMGVPERTTPDMPFLPDIPTVGNGQGGWETPDDPRLGSYGGAWDPGNGMHVGAPPDEWHAQPVTGGGEAPQVQQLQRQLHSVTESYRVTHQKMEEVEAAFHSLEDQLREVQTMVQGMAEMSARVEQLEAELQQLHAAAPAVNARETADSQNPEEEQGFFGWFWGLLGS